MNRPTDPVVSPGQKTDPDGVTSVTYGTLKEFKARLKACVKRLGLARRKTNLLFAKPKKNPNDP